MTVAANTSGRRPFLIRDFSCSLAAGTLTALVGEAGSGKSTALNGIARLTPVLSGTIEIDGLEIGQLRSRALRPLRSRLQLVHQNAYKSLDLGRTVGFALDEPHRIHGTVPLDAEASRALLVRLKLDGVDRATPIGELSFGQRQRLAFARVLSGFPDLRVLMLDEPFSGLDASARQACLALLSERLEAGITVLLATHDLVLVRQIADAVIVLRDGAVAEHLNYGDQACAKPYLTSLFKAADALCAPALARPPAAG